MKLEIVCCYIGSNNWRPVDAEDVPEDIVDDDDDVTDEDDASDDDDEYAVNDANYYIFNIKSGGTDISNNHYTYNDIVDINNDDGDDVDTTKTSFDTRRTKPVKTHPSVRVQSTQ